MEPASGWRSSAEEELRKAEGMRPSLEAAGLAALIGVAVFAAGIAIDWVLLPHQREVLYSDIFTGLIGGGLTLVAFQYYQAHQRSLRARLRAVAEVNHHVRNALTVVLLSVQLRDDPELLAATKESVERIDWVLRKVLPRDF